MCVKGGEVAFLTHPVTFMLLHERRVSAALEAEPRWIAAREAGAGGVSVGQQPVLTLEVVVSKGSEPTARVGEVALFRVQGFFSACVWWRWRRRDAVGAGSGGRSAGLPRCIAAKASSAVPFADGLARRVWGVGGCVAGVVCGRAG